MNKKITITNSTSLVNCLGKRIRRFYLAYVCFQILTGTSIISPYLIAQAVGQSSGQVNDIIYSGDFSVGVKAYQLYVERILPSTTSRANYKIKILYQASTFPLPSSQNNTFISPEGYVIAQATLVNLSDREAFVKATMQSLELIQRNALASALHLVPDDAPFVSGAIDASKEAFRNELRNQFQAIQVQQTKLINAPIAGVARLAKVADVNRSYTDKPNKDWNSKAWWQWKFRGAPIINRIIGRPAYTTTKKGTFMVDSLQMEVEDGNILNVKVHGVYTNERNERNEYLFENYSPIGISTNMDFNDWHLVKLYSQQISIDKALYINLKDVIQYVPNLNFRSNDYSPADGIYNLHPSDPLPKRVFYKVETSKILQARVFSDLAGVNQDRPNGLIQLEVSKKFILVNKIVREGRLFQVGLSNYFDMYASVNKIEENNKYLNIEQNASNKDENLPVKTIDLLRYTNSLYGSDINLLYLFFPVAKYNLYLNGRMQLNRVAVRDSIFKNNNFSSINENNLNVAVYGLGLRGIIRPDSRYGAELRLDWNRYAIVGNTLEQTPPIKGKTVVQRFVNQDVLTQTAILWARVSDHGELFFRPQFSYMRRKPENQYFQVQFGYQFDIFSPRRSSTPIAPLFSTR